MIKNQLLAAEEEQNELAKNRKKLFPIKKTEKTKSVASQSINCNNIDLSDIINDMDFYNLSSIYENERTFKNYTLFDKVNFNICTKSTIFKRIFLILNEVSHIFEKIT